MPYGGGEPSHGVPISESQVGGLLGAGSTRARGGAWQPPSPEELQRDFPLYEIHGILGRGGMGAVYKGWQKSLSRFVAIKILPPGFDDGVSDFAERFKREAKAMANLRHAGIVAVYDAGETPGGLLYFIMECVEGTDVQKLIAERVRIEPGEAVRITLHVCNALGYAHAHGVIHRDIKPSNIMIDADGDVKVADFGLAKSISPDTTVLTMSNITMGTPDFMAPEAMTGTANADHRADIYAVGVMLYQMLTGKLPRGKFDPPSRIVAGLDKRLDRIVDRALQPEPAARYADAAEMAAALEPILRIGGKRKSAGTAGIPPRKMRTPLVLTTAALLAGIGALGYFQPWKKGASHENPNLPAPKPVEPRSAGKDAPFINSLGQEFVPVPSTRVLFCKWETRVKDYAAYAKVNTVDDSWMKQGKALENSMVPVSTEPEYPVCGVNWDDANAFCKWLTEKESAEGRLPKGMSYRLPTDEEWSRAVGLPPEDGATPKERHRKNDKDYPWGTEFPPPPRVGNYADSTYHLQFPKEKNWMQGYTDGFALTAPVGSFPANAFGIHDLGGNVWEWCEDLFEPGGTQRTARGAAWVNSGLSPLSASRMNDGAEKRQRDIGFRVVLDLGGRENDE